MKNSSKTSNNLDPLEVPISSSLAHLAYGDVSFTAWRKVKQEANKNEANLKSSTGNEEG